MALVPGTRIGSYEILSALGAGGMGEVYRAGDSKLNRAPDGQRRRIRLFRLDNGAPVPFNILVERNGSPNPNYGRISFSEASSDVRLAHGIPNLLPPARGKR